MRRTDGCVRAAAVVGAAHVIDDRGEIDLFQFVGDGEKVILEAEHLDEPVKLADAGKPAAEIGHARRQLEPAAEIKPRAAHADAVEPFKLCIADTVVDNGDAAIVLLAYDLEHVVQRPVIGAVDRRLHEHRAIDAHGVVQRLHSGEIAIAAAAHRAHSGWRRDTSWDRRRCAGGCRRCFWADVWACLLT